MAIADASIFAPAPYCVTRPIAKSDAVELLCVGPEMKVFTIDGVSAFIWQQLDGKNSVREILGRVLKEFEASPTRAKRDLLTFLDQLIHMDLIQER